MLIKIDDITESGLHIKTRKSADWVTNIPEIVNEARELSLNRDIDIDCNVTKILKEISINGSIQLGIKTQCSRCLENVELDLESDIKLTLMPMDEDEESESIDHEVYEGETVDLSNYIREHIAIVLPERVVCSESCKGLCSGCGADLNKVNCKCEKELNSSAFSVLKGLKI